MNLLVVVVFAVTLGAWAQNVEVRLEPGDGSRLGDWAQASVPLRLKPTGPQDVKFDGPSLATALWGEFALGQAKYAVLLGTRATGEVNLWVDRNRDRRLTTDEGQAGTAGPGRSTWSVSLRAEPSGGEPYTYALSILWPEGRGYVYLLGGAPKVGTLIVDQRSYRLAFLDGDLDGVYGTKGDFYAVDVDGDGVFYADPDGHERFELGETFTVGDKTYRLAQVAPSGTFVRVAPTVYAPPKPALIPGHPAPDFRFTSLVEDRSLALSDFRGKVVLLDFWATWCGPCMNELPHLKDLHAKYRGQGFEIVGVSLDIYPAELKRVVEGEGLAWPIAFEGKQWDNSLALMYRVYQIPTSYLLDRKGIIRYRDLHGGELEQKIMELLAEGSAQAPEAVPLPPVVLPAGPPRSILELNLPPRAGLVARGKTQTTLQLVNTSPYEAEEVKVLVQNLPAGVKAQEVEVGNIPPFGERTVTLAFEAQDLPTALPAGLVLVVYHYCIGDACFQMVDKGELAWVVGREAPVRASWNPWWVLVAVGVALLAAWALKGRLLVVVLVLLVVGGSLALALGIRRGQARQAERVGATLCTSCVGIEEAPRRQVALSAQARSILATLTRRVRVTVFYTAWCKSCPYVKAVVQAMAQVNPLVEVELVDAEGEPARAEAAGVLRAGRLVVPATVVAGSGQVLFGADNIEDRVLQQLVRVGR